MLTIRTAFVEDIALIRELTFKIWPPTYEPILTKEQIAYMLDMMYSTSSLQQQFDGGHNFILCFDDEQPVGFASWSEIQKGVYKLHKIYLLPARQGSGIGRFMIEYIISALKKQNATALELNVNRYNPAKIFYERLGFKIIREEDIDIGGGYFMNDYVMKYDL